jgi:hypothetical protein
VHDLGRSACASDKPTEPSTSRPPGLHRRDRNFEAICSAGRRDFRWTSAIMFHSDGMLQGTDPDRVVLEPARRLGADRRRRHHARPRDARREASSASCSGSCATSSRGASSTTYEDLILMRDRLRGVEMDIRGPFWSTSPTGGSRAPGRLRPNQVIQRPVPPPQIRRPRDSAVHVVERVGHRRGKAGRRGRARPRPRPTACTPCRACCAYRCGAARSV